jgi:hypothetical protein
MSPTNRKMIQLSSMIVFLIIVIILSFYELQPVKKNPEYCIQVVFAANANGHHSPPLPYWNPYDNIRRSKYEHYYLTEDAGRNEKILNNFSKALHRLKNRNDTLDGIHIKLSDKTSWQDYIHVLDICFAETKRFVPDSNDIWIPNPNRLWE